MQEPSTAEQEAPDEATATEIHTEHDGAAEEEAPTVVETKRLSKRLRGRQVLRSVSIKVRQGQVYGLLGAGGAGKTTLAKILLGFWQPDGGEIHLFGSESLQRSKMRTGYLPQRARYHGNISGRDYLRFQASLGGLSNGDAKQAASAAEEQVGLRDAAKRRISSYSKEQLRRLGLAVALVSGGMEPPELLVLDEPTGGVGDDFGAEMRDVLAHCVELGSTILLCSHELTPVERLCTHVGILRGGRLIAQTPVDLTPRTNVVGLAREGAMEIAPYLIAYLRRLHPEVIVEGGTGRDEPLFVGLPTGEKVLRAEAIKAAALRAMLDAKWDIVSVYVESRDIESLYLQAVPSKPKVETEEPEEEAEEERPRAKAPDTSPLAAGGAITPPLSDSSTSRVGSEVDGAASSSSARAGGPSTTPLGTIESQAVLDRSMGDVAEQTAAQGVTQLEPRRLRDRSNGVNRPDTADDESEARLGSEESAALVRDGS
jgi:ABC-2 type transport system ATP-binding protein